MASECTTRFDMLPVLNTSCPALVLSCSLLGPREPQLPDILISSILYL